MKTQKTLKMTEDEYEMHIMNWWTSYCAQKGRSPEQVQKLMINNALYNWWRAQLRDVESEFEEDAKPFRSCGPKDLQKLYAKHAYKLQLYYNHNLIKEALKNEPAN